MNNFNTITFLIFISILVFLNILNIYMVVNISNNEAKKSNDNNPSRVTKTNYIALYGSLGFLLLTTIILLYMMY